MKLTKKSKIITSTIIIVVLVAGSGFYIFNRKTWFFTPVYSDRQTAQRFLAELYKGNLTDAYKLTSDVFLAKNSYDSFKQGEQQFTGSNMKTTFSAHASSKQSSVVSGNISNIESGQRYAFAIDLVSASNGTKKVDSVVIAQVN
jgi:hypothetical protein